MTKNQNDQMVMYAIGKIYCRGNHKDSKYDEEGMCEECRLVIDTTLHKAQKCPYGHTGNCKECNTHCQRGEARERIRKIMRYSAPRMALRHPLMTLQYVKKTIMQRKQNPTGQ